MIFWKLIKRPFKWCVSIGALICHFSALDHSWYRQIVKYFYLSNMIFDDTIFSKISENHDIGSTEFKLWQLIESTLVPCENLERNQPDLSTISKIQLTHMSMSLWSFPSGGTPAILPVGEEQARSIILHTRSDMNCSRLSNTCCVGGVECVPPTF